MCVYMRRATCAMCSLASCDTLHTPQDDLVELSAAQHDGSAGRSRSRSRVSKGACKGDISELPIHSLIAHQHMWERSEKGVLVLRGRGAVVHGRRFTKVNS